MKSGNNTLSAGPAQKSAEQARRPESIPTALRLFASVFQREVDRALLGEIEANRWGLSAALGGDTLAGLDLSRPDDIVEVLAIEYCRLFVGPRAHLPPVESVVRGEGRFWGPSAEKIAEFYRSVGMASPESSCMLPDHISMQLGCLAALEESGQHDKATVFAHAHILHWLPKLTQHIAERATNPFYKVWAAGLQGMLTELYRG